MTEEHNLIEKDTAEYLHNSFFYPQQPKQPASSKSTLREYTQELEFLGEKLCRYLISEMLDLEPEAKHTALTAGSASQSLIISVRTDFYELDEDEEALPGICQGQAGPAGHTILLADGAPGLEVRKDGRLVKVKPIFGGLIINIGDLLEICSNGLYKSVEQRGMSSYKEERLTVAMFQIPQMDAAIAPIGSLLGESHPPLFKTTPWEIYFYEFGKAGLAGKGGTERHKL